jgi:DNA-binding transcriptional ArsR family regulator
MGMKRPTYKRYPEVETKAQMERILDILSQGPVNSLELRRQLKLSKSAIHHRLTVLRNEGKVRYDQRDGTIFWSLGEMEPCESKPKVNLREYPKCYLRWGGYAA